MAQKVTYVFNLSISSDFPEDRCILDQIAGAIECEADLSYAVLEELKRLGVEEDSDQVHVEFVGAVVEEKPIELEDEIDFILEEEDWND